MQVAAIDVWVVNVALTTTFASSVNAGKVGTTRTIVRVRSDDGAQGWGETMLGQPTAALVERLKDQFLGLDPRASAEVRRRCAMVPFFHGYVGYCAVAALEMAFVDLSCRAAAMPLHLYLGGASREVVPITALLTAGAAESRSRADLPAALADEARRTVDEGGFRTLKFKGSPDVRFDVDVLTALREALPEVALRIDPNGAWSVPEAVGAAQALEPLALEYLEDPCWGLEPMARVKQRTSTPLCTNMWVVQPDHLAPAVRMNAVDIIHADVHKWGGIRPTMDLYAVCLAFGLGINFHSGGELGISTACHLQVAAAFDHLDYALDAMYYLASEDVLAEPLGGSHGALAVPSGDGLGVEVDLDRLEHCARRNAAEGDYG